MIVENTQEENLGQFLYKINLKETLSEVFDETCLRESDCYPNTLLEE